MGLDVYLSTLADHEQDQIHNQAINAHYDRPDYDKLSEEEREAAYADLPKAADPERVPSEEFPEHLFNRRYLRSSYNDGGFNHAVPDFLGTRESGTYPNQEGSLYWIFAPLGEDPEAIERLTADDIPKLRECHDRAVGVWERLGQCDPLRVATITANMFGNPQHTATDALRLFREERDKNLRLLAENPERAKWMGNAYSTHGGDMDYWGDGFTILATVVGVDDVWREKRPAVHLIYRSEAIDSYIQSAKITAEFCAEAIMLIERDGGAGFMWSA